MYRPLYFAVSSGLFYWPSQLLFRKGEEREDNLVVHPLLQGMIPSYSIVYYLAEKLVVKEFYHFDELLWNSIVSKNVPKDLVINAIK